MSVIGVMGGVVDDGATCEALTTPASSTSSVCGGWDDAVVMITAFFRSGG